MSFRRISSFDIAIAARAERPAAPVFVRDGKFVVREIMRQAVKIARKGKASGLAWTERMRVGLRLTWAKARVAMAAGADVSRQVVAKPAPAPRVALAHFARRPARPAGWTNGARIYSNGW